MKKNFRERLTKREKEDGETPLVATINEEGRFVLPDDYRIRPREARRFAQWILAALKATAP